MKKFTRKLPERA